MKKPFSYLSTDNSKDIANFVRDTFFSDPMVINSFESKQHSFIWGSRGTGKSTLLQYYALGCQLNESTKWEAYKATPESIVGIYIPIKHGIFEEGKFIQLDEYLRTQVVYHYFNVLVCENIAQQLHAALNNDNQICDENSKYKNTFFDIIGASSNIREEHDNNKEFLEFLVHFFAKEKFRINNYLMFGRYSEYIQNITCCITDYNNFIVSFIELLKKYLHIDKPLYLMIDDAENLPEQVQAYLNLWISNRDNHTLVIKASAVPLRYKNFNTPYGKRIDFIHDYTQIELDYTKRTDWTTFKRGVIEISENRLGLSDFTQKDPYELFPENTTEKYTNKLSNARSKAVQTVEQSGEQFRDPTRQVNRLTSLFTFHELGKSKTPRSYAGLDTIINLSSGNYRNFIIIASAINDMAENKGWKENSLYFDHNIQQDAIVNLSRQTIENIKENRSTGEKLLANRAYNLIQFLCDMCLERFRHWLIESNLTSFTVRGEISTELEDIIKYCLAERYLYESVPYRSRQGNTMNSVYSLNKLFLPKYNLDPSPAAGRISIQADILYTAIDKPSEALSSYKKALGKKKPDAEEFPVREEMQYEVDESL